MNIIPDAPKSIVKLLAAGTISLVLGSQSAFAGDYGQDTGDDQQGQQTQSAGQDQQVGQQRDEQRQQEQQAGETGEVTALVAVNGRNVPVEEIENLDVVNAQGEEVGQVQDVVTNGDKAAVVVGVGGLFGLGAKDILVDLEDVTIQDDRLVWQIEADQETLEDFPEYNKEEYVSIR